MVSISNKYRSFVRNISMKGLKYLCERLNMISKKKKFFLIGKSHYFCTVLNEGKILLQNRLNKSSFSWHLLRK